MLTALAAALPLVAARLFVGPGAAFVAACVYLGVRGVVSFIVTDVFGQAHYVFALALGSAVLIELLGATSLRRKPLWFGAIGGLLIGTVGTAIEGVWTQYVYAFPWARDMWAEGLAMTVPVAIGAGLCGALFALGLNGRLPAKRVSVTIVVLTLLAISGATANGLHATVPKNARATVALQQVGMPGKPEVIANVRLEPASLIDEHPTWVTILSWQGGGEGVINDQLRRTGPNTWESTKPMPVYGRGGLSLTEKWREGARTLHGIHSHGFPNFFILSTIQSAWGSNFPHMMDEQARHISYVIKEVRERGAQIEEVTEDAENAWVALHEQFSEFMLRIWAQCTPSYFNNEGHPSPVIARNGGFGAGVPAMVDILSKWRDAGALEGLALDRSA